MPKYLNLAAYLFFPMDDPGRWREEIKRRAMLADLRGTVLLSPEGINLFVAGPTESTREWLAWLKTSQEGLASLETKESWSDHQPFNRMLVRLKKEIISFGVEGIDPGRETSPKLAPAQLKRWLDEGRDITLLDVRNDYEVEVGTFEGAHPIGIDHFRHFPEAIGKLPEEMKRRAVVMFCTGGIRCEKAGPLMHRDGFNNVFQLDGGILKYFEECGGKHYRGDCFVFDKRVALDPSLEPSGLTLCFACQAVLTPDEVASAQYVFEQSCPRCYREPDDVVRGQLRERSMAIAAAINPLPGSFPRDNNRPIHVPGRFDGLTLWQCLTQMHPHLGNDYWQAEFASGHIRRAGESVVAERIVRGGERYDHIFPATVEPPVSGEIEVLHEDEAIVAVNKPAPLPMHPSGRYHHNTLTAILNRVYHPLVLKPIHRLDRQTTGVVLLAKSKSIAHRVQSQLEQGGIEKIYLAEVNGCVQQEYWTCQLPIGHEATAGGGRAIDALGQSAETRFRVIQRRSRTTLLEAIPVTGRTNQIRLHLAAEQFPIIGDRLYGDGEHDGDGGADDTAQAVPLDRPIHLHAYRVRMIHPLTQQPISFTAPPPDWARNAPMQM